MAGKDSYNVEKYRDSLDFRAKVIKSILDRHGGMLKWRGKERVLDIGCGPGDVTRQCFLPLLPHNFTQLVCADLSSEMLKAARKEFLGVEHVDFQQMDIQNAPTDRQKGSFDRIFSTFCFMYIANQGSAFANVFDLLAPGGDCWIFQITTSPILQPLFQLAETPKWKSRLENFRQTFVFPFWNDPNPVATAEEFLKPLGFEDVSIKLIDGNIQMESEKYFEVFMESLPVPSDNLTEEDKKDLLRDQIEIGKTLNFFKTDTEESFMEPYKVLLIYGRKPMN